MPIWIPRSLRVARGVPVLLAAVLSLPAQAQVTYLGDNGVFNWLQSSSIWAPATPNGCLSCHVSGGAADPYFLDTYADATAESTINPPASRADEILRRITIDRSNSDCMPLTAFPCPTVSNTALIQSRIDDGTLESAAPSVQTVSAISVARNSATLRAAINANGLATTYVFEWGQSGAGFTESSTAAPTPSTNGGPTAENVSLAIAGLLCETEYQFRATATNADGNGTGSTLTFTTSACNFPVVRFEGSQVRGVGDSVSIPVLLEGDITTVYTYPTHLQYQVSGTAAPGDTDLSSGTLTINSPDTSAELAFNVINNTLSPEDETVVIDITSATDDDANQSATVPMPSTHTVVISGNTNVISPPPLEVRQAGLAGLHVYQDSGGVTVTANAGAGGGLVTYDWSATDAALSGTASGDEYSFDPAAVAPGTYGVAVTVDNGVQVTHYSASLTIDANAPTLTCNLDMADNVLPESDADGNGICDQIEGYGDFDFDGIPDYQDPTGDPTRLNLQVTATGDNQSRLMTTTAGLTLGLNDTAAALVASGDATGAAIAAGAVASAPGYSVMSGIYDFQVWGLSDLQRTATVVIPLERTMPSNTVYRKFVGGAWMDFVETDMDKILSARSDAVDNECPPPDDPAYEPGLIAFNDCLELTLTDGGPNDADGEVNGVIRDPGAVMLPDSEPTNNVSPDADNAPSGAGALDWAWLILFAPLLWLYYRLRQGYEHD